MRSVGQSSCTSAGCKRQRRPCEVPRARNGFSRAGSKQAHRRGGLAEAQAGATPDGLCQGG
ncbi:MAG: hypothetical protein ANABAC_3567 [Anaerolineae bacterium]|nr:MAG: hypothetical protein ANABAC_3567 [Anaerolineae bacterium]